MKENQPNPENDRAEGCRRSFSPAGCVFLLSFALVSVATAALPRLAVSENGRFLVAEESVPFFYLGDTAWQMLYRMDRGEIDRYLADRAAKRFTVVQCVILGELDGLETPNREGNLPLHALDPARPNVSFFELVDYTLQRAEERGLYVALLPTWGSHVEDKPHPRFKNYHPFNAENARRYGEFLGRRYSERTNVIWMLGGDRSPVGHEAIWNALAAGIRKHDTRSLMTYHCQGYASAARYWRDAPWLDFNLIQSGHARFSTRNWQMIEREYEAQPVRPVFDAEPAYEEHPAAFDPANPCFTDYDVRKAAYWAVFAGAFGHTYGHHSVWQVYRPGQDAPILDVSKGWQEGLSAPGAGQMQHLRALLESRPFLSRIPDQSLVKDLGMDTDHVQVTRDGSVGQKNATTIMVYLPMSRELEIDTSVIAGERLRAWWFDPRTGEARSIGETRNTGRYRRPAEQRTRREWGGPDWVLVIDDAAAGYPPPGGVLVQDHAATP